MAFKDLIAQNVLLRWITGRRGAPDLELSMAGVRLGERVAQVGLGDGALLVAMAAKVGYTGRACGVDEDPSAIRRARAAAEREGVLVELQQDPPSALALDAGSFDLLVIQGVRSSVEPSPPVLTEALRVLRPGGRCLVIVGAAGNAPPGELVRRLQQSGFRASRELAHREGLAFFEAMKGA